MSPYHEYVRLARWLIGLVLIILATFFVLRLAQPPNNLRAVEPFASQQELRYVTAGSGSQTVYYRERGLRIALTIEDVMDRLKKHNSQSNGWTWSVGDILFFGTNGTQEITVVGSYDVIDKKKYVGVWESTKLTWLQAQWVRQTERTTSGDRPFDSF